MASPTHWTWVWASSKRWWMTEKPGMLQSMGSQSQTQLSDWTTTIEKDPDAGKDSGQEKKGVAEDEMVGWHHQLMDMSLSKLWEIVKDREAWHGVTKSQARLIDWTTTKFHPPHYNWLKFITFYGWVIFHYIYASHLSYPFFSWWTSRLLSCLGYYKPCCNEHWDSCVVLIFFFRVYLQ